MWFYLGLITLPLAFTIFLYRKIAAKSALAERDKALYPGSVPGKPYRISWEPAQDKSPAVGKIEISCVTSLQFSIRHETSKDKWAKRLGISHEFQTGHPNFDDKFYISSAVSEDVALLSEDSETRKLIAQALSACSNEKLSHTGWDSRNELICDGQTLYMILHHRDPSITNPKQFAEKTLPKLTELAKKLTTFKHQGIHFWKVPTQLSATIIVASCSALAVLGGIEFFRFMWIGENKLLHSYALLPHTILLSLVGLTSMIFATFFLVNKDARRHLVLLEVCLTGFFGMLMSGYSWLHDINIKFDPSPARHIITTMSHKYSVYHRTRRRSYYTYHLRFDAPPDPIPQQLQVDIGDYRKVSDGDMVQLTVYQGLLHEPWLADISRYNSW